MLLAAAGALGVSYLVSPQNGTADNSTTNGAYYRYCSDARAAGAAPLYRNQLGYREELDRDGDGVACQPYFVRRRFEIVTCTCGTGIGAL